jgi:hypothetical protein
MNKDSPDQVTGGSHQGAGPSAAEESLSEALNGLEQILEQRKPAPPGVHEPDREQPKPGLADPQYTIPLLHDVVVPGGDEPNEPLSDQPRGEEPLEPRAEATEACRKLAERLANEIEVIVQARTETAVQEAAEDIREQVRNHLEIMLPELIEDLNALRRR